MYKESLVSDEANRNMAKRIKSKMVDVAAKVADSEQSDAIFVANLLDLCTLNRMEESHRDDDHNNK